MKKVQIIANIAPLYVKPLWSLFIQSNDFKFSFMSSRTGHKGIRVLEKKDFDITNIEPDICYVRNIYFGKVLIYQFGVISNILRNKKDIYIFNADMYTISTWLATFLCKIRKKTIFFWGHGYYGNEKGIKKYCRLLFYKLADYHFLYGNRAKEFLISFGFDSSKLFVVYNSLDYDTHKKILETTANLELLTLKKSFFTNNAKIPLILFVGRLTKEKKLNQLFLALNKLSKNGLFYNCLIVGDGKERNSLENLVRRLNLTEHVYFFGESYDESITAKLVMSSDVCVSPGNVGLTAMHSMGLGTPVITHDNFNHQMPEAECIIHGVTGYLFKENDLDSLADIIQFGNYENVSMKRACVDIVEKYYNPRNQYNIIKEALLIV